MKIVLGTAQFGSAYGIKNKYRNMQSSKIFKMLDYAYESGIRYLDTAESYGNFINILSTYETSKFNFITKINYHKNFNKEYIINLINKTLSSLKVKTLYGLLLHDPGNYSKNELKKIFLYLTELKNKNIIKKIGFSIYDPKEYYSYRIFFQPDLVQGPLNIFDRSVIKSKLLNNLKNDNVEFQARSIFLQGLLLMNSRNGYFKKWDYVFDIFEKELKRTKLKNYEYAINFVKQEKFVDYITFGADKQSHINEFCNAFKIRNFSINSDLQISEKKLINPSSWVLKKN